MLVLFCGFDFFFFFLSFFFFFFFCTFFCTFFCSWVKLLISGKFQISILNIVGGEKVSFPTNEIYVGLGGLNRNSTMGLMHDLKAIGIK